MDTITSQSATALTRALAAGKISAVDALQACLDRVKAVNGPVNAVVTLDEEGAMTRARQADAARARGALWGPLHGLPMTIKDSWQTAGLRTTSGAKEFAQFVPKDDAVPVARLKAAGAIIFGKTNLPTYAADIQSYNAIFGTTNNPWDMSRTVGGSSGGAAAALATGMTPLELGSDLAGSIRVPAAMCGVFGHKPSYRAIPMRGHIPGPPGTLSEADLAVAGPLARSAADLQLAMDVLAGPNTREGTAWRLRFPKARHKALKDYRIACWFDDPYCPVQEALRDKLESLAAKLEQAGARVDRTARPPFSLKDNHDVYLGLLGAVVGAGLPPKLFRQMQTGLPVARLMRRLGRFAPEMVAYLEGCTQSTRHWIAANEARTRLRAGWDGFFERYDVLLTPVLPTNAFVHNTKGNVLNRKLVIDGITRHYLELFIWCGLATTSYLPVTTAPVGLARDGLPSGVQIIGPYLEDRTGMDFAARVEKLTGGFIAPPS